jgi:hypothetical protein
MGISQNILELSVQNFNLHCQGDAIKVDKSRHYRKVPHSNKITKWQGMW